MRPALYPVLFRRPLRGGPDLDLNFAAMTVLDPRVTYSGASLATLTDAAGAIAYKPHNLLLYSTPSTANWVLQANVTLTSGTVVDPSGAMTGVTVSWGSASVGGGFYLGVTAVNGAANTKALYVRADVAGGTVDLADPSVTAGTTTATLTTSWQRISLSEAAGAQPTNGGTWLRKTASSPATVYVCWASFNLGPLQPYYPTTSAPYYGPRFTYDPVTLSALGLLIEEQRTNLALRSEAFSNAAWAKSRVTAVDLSDVSPAGLTDAALITEDTANNTHQLEQTISVAANTTVTASCFVKPNGRNLRITVYTASHGLRASFDLNNRTATNGSYGSSSFLGSSVTQLNNGWYRVVLTGIASTTESGLTFAIELLNGSTSFYTGDGTSGIYLWGAQLEAGAFATTYIPTTSASVTRAADSATMTGSNFSSWFNATQGTFVVGWTTAKTSRAIIISDGSFSNYLEVLRLNTFSAGAYVGPSTGDPVVGSGAYASGQFAAGESLKSAASYSATALIAAQRGSSTTAAAPTFTGINSLRIGVDSPNVTAVVGSHTISRIRYYNTALTNAQLQALTT